MITIEDGTGIAGANSYATPEQATDYHALRLNDAWAASGPVQQAAALVRATDYLEATYRAPTAPLNPLQGLQWPCEGDTAVPAAIVAATIVLALYALTGPLIAPAVRGTSKSTKKLEGVGELVSEFDAPITDPFPAVTSLLAGVASLRTSDTASTGGLIMGRLTR